MDELNTGMVNDDAHPENQEQEHHEPTEAENRARRMGWTPEEEWDDSTMERRPRKFLSAEEYIDKVENDVPILRERNRYLNGVAEKLEKQLNEATGTIKSTNERVAELGELVESLHNQNVEVGKRAYERGVAEAKAIQRRAVEEADTEAYNYAERLLNDLEQNKPVEKPAKGEKKPDPEPAQQSPQQQQGSPEAMNWVTNNQKIWNDLPMKAAAIALHEQNVLGGMSEADSLAKLTDQVKAEFPHKFANPRRNEPAAVSGSSPPKRSANKETFESLPADAKQTYERLKKYFEGKGKEYKPDQFAKSYYLNLKEQRA